jgi:hypothetical protein
MTPPMNSLHTLALLACAFAAVACGPPGSSSDARCSSLCQYKGPGTYGPYCDQSSASQCAGLCEAHIKGVATLCQTCLLESATFTAEQAGSGSNCTNNQCTVSFGGRSCTYTVGDQAQMDACQAQVYPPTATTCTPTFRPVTQCASVCTTTP